MKNQTRKISNETTMTRKHDIVLLCIEMTEQVRNVRNCWESIRQIHQVRSEYPQEFKLSCGFYRTAFDALATSLFIGLGRLYDKDGDTYSLYALQTLLSDFRESHAARLKEKSQKLRELSPLVEVLRQRRNKQYAHNDQETAWDFEELKRKFVLDDEGIEILIAFACEYCDFFVSFYFDNPLPDRHQPCTDLENTFHLLREAKKDRK